MLLLFAMSTWSPPGWTSPKLQKFTVKTSREAWYHVFPSPSPLPVIPDPVNPYAQNTLHVGITAGREDARTYIALDLPRSTSDMTFRDGFLLLPLDPGDGSLDADSANLRVCLAEDVPKDQEGSFEEPPEVDCETKSGADFHQRPYPHFLVDLNPFGALPRTSELAIVPTEAAAANAETWHVAFYGRKSEAEDAKPITAELYFQRVGDAVGTPPVLDPGPDTGDSTQVDDSGPSTFGEIGGIPLVGGEPPPANAEPPYAEDQVESPVDTEPAPEVQAAELVAAEQPDYTGIIWSLPLLALALGLFFGSSLSDDPSL